MTTTLNDRDNVVQSIEELCDAYLLIKPVDTGKLPKQLRSFGLLPLDATPSIPGTGAHRSDRRNP